MQHKIENRHFDFVLHCGKNSLDLAANGNINLCRLPLTSLTVTLFTDSKITVNIAAATEMRGKAFIYR